MSISRVRDIVRLCSLDRLAMGSKGGKHRQAEPVEGLEEDRQLSVIPVFRTSIRVSTTQYYI